MENEKLLIDAKRLIKKITEDNSRADSTKNYYKVIVNRQPKVDAVEVVRCKDCISGHTQYYGNLLRCNVMGCGGLKPDDFCSYGERRV